MQTTKDIISDLNDLLTRNYDAEKGYLEAAEKVEHDGLKQYMMTRAKNRYDFGHDLKDIIRDLNGEVDKGSSLKGDVHRMWMNLKDILTSGDKGIYQECIRGEEKFIETYREMLKDDSLPKSLRSLLTQQLNDADRAIENLKIMKESIES